MENFSADDEQATAHSDSRAEIFSYFLNSSEHFVQCDSPGNQFGGKFRAFRLKFRELFLIVLDSCSGTRVNPDELPKRLKHCGYRKNESVYNIKRK